MIHSTDFTFELVCSSIEEWHNILQKFTVLPSLSKTELAKKIRDLGLKVIGILETREAARIRNENKLKRARELESIPKKRSRRLEAKVTSFTVQYVDFFSNNGYNSLRKKRNCKKYLI